MRDITTVNLADLVPDSIKNDPSVAAAIEAINGDLQAVSKLCLNPALYARIDELDSDTLDHMAWQVDSKIWRDTWPVHIKRSVIKTVILEKAKKGTRYSVQQALESFGAAAVIKEWFEQSPQAIPHTFDVVISVADIPGQTSASVQGDLVLRLDDVKPVRSHYNLSLAIQAASNLYIGGAIRAASYARLKNF